MGTVHQTVKFKASPHEIYEMLMDSEKHAAFSESKCEISREVGEKFTCYNGWIEGENVELQEGLKIVQKWRGKDWPEGHYSTATFLLKKTEDGGTELEFTQTDVPDDQVEHIEKGWKDHYWDKIRKYLAE